MGLSLSVLLISCAEKYPYFVQVPEFEVENAEDESGETYPGIMLSIVCEDKNATIRYTVDDSEPSESHGLVYENPLYLSSTELTVKAVAVREGYDAGPVAEYHYDPES